MAFAKRVRVVRKVSLLGAGEPPGGRRGTSVVVALHRFPIHIGHRRELELSLSEQMHVLINRNKKYLMITLENIVDFYHPTLPKMKMVRITQALSRNRKRREIQRRRSNRFMPHGLQNISRLLPRSQFI